MKKELSEELQEEIRKHNAKEPDKSEHISMQDILAEIGSTENEEVMKAIELLKAKNESQN